MKRFLPLPVFLLLATITMGQGYIGPSPNATAMMRQANVGVSHYTGAANISIPLAELSGRELGVSASLSYNSSGHRVQDIASSEGLGWTLAAGGMITRVVRGEPDDLANGFCTPDKSDQEPDLFIFSFMGRSGKFVLDRDGNAVLFPFQDLDISPGICGNRDTWEITDENGTRYRFGGSAMGRETTTYRPVDNSQPAKSYVSTWHLEKVLSLNGTDQMDFNYTSSQVTYINYLFTKEDGCAMGTQEVRDMSTRMTVSTKYISTVQTSGGTMDFSWNSHREDITGGKSLAGVRVADPQGNQVKKLRLEYGYFQSCATQLCKRLRLEAVYDLSPDPLYSFVYNTSDNLPARDSRDIDYLGLYNRYLIPNNQWIPYDPGVDGAGPYGSRNPSAPAMQANLLERIDHRSGGYTSFYFQPHQGYFNGQLKDIVSGNRVYLTVEADGMGNIQRTRYRYVTDGDQESSGRLFRLPTFGVELTKNGSRVLLKRYSHSYTEMFDVNGTHIGYSRVEEEIEGKGKTVYTFTNYDSHPDLDPAGNAENGSPPFVSLTSRFWERGNLLEATILDLQNRLVSRDTYEYTFDHPVKSQISGTKSLFLGYLCAVDDHGSETRTGEYTVVSRPFTLKKKTTDLYDQEDPANSKKITHVEAYQYDPATYQLTKSTRWNAAMPSDKYETVNKYVTHPDYSYSQAQACQDSYRQCLQSCADAACTDNCYSVYSDCLEQSVSDERIRTIQSLRARHANSTLVEQQQWIDRNGTRTLLGAVLSLYRFAGTEGNLIVPASSWTAEKVTGTYNGSRINGSGQFVQPSAFRFAGSFDEYDGTYARPLRTTAGDGTVTATAWTHNHTLPGTVTVNPGTQGLATAYEYRPLVGTTKETDPNGRSVSTEYDHLGRTRLVRDHEGNIRERYRYHYREETPSVRIKADRPQALTGQAIDFTLEDIVLPTGGTAEFAWDMDNGTVHDDSRQAASQSYSVPGLYTVKAVLFTNESKPYTATLDMLVSRPMNVALCADGPQWVDLCHQEPVIYGSCTAGNNQPGSPTVFHASFSPALATGCPGMYTYKWEYKKSTSGTWLPINSLTSSATFPQQHLEGTYDIRCTVTDGCGNTATASGYVNLYRSNPLCSP